MGEEEQMKQTSNAQRPTLNVECRGSEFLIIGCSALGVGRYLLSL
jgi:hypothetical protein